MKFTRAIPIVVCCIIALAVPASYGLKCLSCSDVPNPRDCSFVQHCTAHQVCSSELFVTAIGAVRYNVGCKDFHTCGSSTVSNAAVQVVCSQCCDSKELCNVEMCNAGGYGPLTTRGPVCFNCHSVPDPNSCDKVKVCGVDDACAIMENKSTHSFDLACVTKTTICPTLHAPGTRTGCCEQDACTSATDIAIPTTRAPSTTPSTTPGTTQGPVTSGCQDDPTCASLQTAYQGVHKSLCHDPKLSSAYCKKTCGLCSGGSITNACSSNPCQHGMCTQSGTGYTCTCFPGYSGHTCQQDVNDCASNPCRHGTCTDRVNDYTCTCRAPYYGRHCMSADGGWSAWSHWSTCSVTCGTGSQTRHRSCNNPAPHHDGSACSGSNSEARNCNTHRCPDFDDCASSPCHHGSCTDRVNGYTCTCITPYYGRHCMSADGGWSAWSHWSTCSVTCGTGSQTRHRACNNPAPHHDGSACSGSNSEARNCNTHRCPAIPCHSKSLFCNFDRENKCGWYQNPRDGDFDWSMGSGSTDTPGTGPSSAHSGSSCMFIKAIGRNNGDAAILTSPHFCGGKDWCLSFYYYMYGRDVNSLSVETNSGQFIREMQLLHNKGPAWHQYIVKLHRYNHDNNFNVHIRATVGKSQLSDIAIDDVRVYPC